MTTGSVVQVSVANVDRGKLDPTNATLVVVELVEKKKIVLYRVAGCHGVCKDLFARAYVRLLPDVSPAHLGLDTVLRDWRTMPTVPLRTLVTAASATGGQGMRRCSCKGKCDNNKCACSKAGHRCNSRCHKGSTTCTNCDLRLMPAHIASLNIHIGMRVWILIPAHIGILGACKMCILS